MIFISWNLCPSILPFPLEYGKDLRLAFNKMYTVKVMGYYYYDFVRYDSILPADHLTLSFVDFNKTGFHIETYMAKNWSQLPINSQKESKVLSSIATRNGILPKMIWDWNWILSQWTFRLVFSPDWHCDRKLKVTLKQSTQLSHAQIPDPKKWWYNKGFILSY